MVGENNSKLDNISKQVQGLMDLFKKASEEMKTEEEIHKQLIQKVDEIEKENKTIAQSILALADMINEIKQKIDRKPVPMRPMPPNPMSPVQRIIPPMHPQMRQQMAQPTHRQMPPIHQQIAQSRQMQPQMRQEMPRQMPQMAPPMHRQTPPGMPMEQPRPFPPQGMPIRQQFPQPRPFPQPGMPPEIPGLPPLGEKKKGFFEKLLKK